MVDLRWLVLTVNLTGEKLFFSLSIGLLLRMIFAESLAFDPRHNS
jgi:hypothetical protein